MATKPFQNKIVIKNNEAGAVNASPRVNQVSNTKYKDIQTTKMPILICGTTPCKRRRLPIIQQLSLVYWFFKSIAHETLHCFNRLDTTTTIDLKKMYKGGVICLILISVLLVFVA